ncbi:MAG: ABC transporter transmembrane domain-containing protein, partial [Myxococcota bacterium]
MSSDPHEEAALGRVYDSDLLARLWPFVRPYKGLVALSLLLIPLRGALEVVPPLIIGAALNYIIHGEVTSDIAWLEPWLLPHFGLSPLSWLFSVILVLAVTLLVLEWLRSASMILLGQRTVMDVRRSLFDHIQRLPMRFFDRYPVGRLVTRLTNDLENLAEMFSLGVVALVADVAVMGLYAYVIF